jgi:transcriptional regulator with PAS, ATPase and Fis domain
MTRGPRVSRKSPRPGTAGPRSTGRLQRAIDTAVVKEITAALRETDGNVTQAAKALDVSLRGLWKRLETLNIDPADFRK